MPKGRKYQAVTWKPCRNHPVVHNSSFQPLGLKNMISTALNICQIQLILHNFCKALHTLIHEVKEICNQTNTALLINHNIYGQLEIEQIIVISRTKKGSAFKDSLNISLFKATLKVYKACSSKCVYNIQSNNLTMHNSTLSF